MGRKCKNCGYEPEFDEGYERCTQCYQLYEVEDYCKLCEKCLGCMLNKMKTNANQRDDD